MISVKHKLYELCLAQIQERITISQQSIQAAQASSNEETKSSAGDKYETGRAMAQLEIEKSLAQLTEAQRLRNTLVALGKREAAKKIQAGSLVMTDKGNYYLTIPAGQFTIDQQTYFAISVDSPIGAKLVGLKEGDVVIFRDRSYRILGVS